MQRGFEYEDLKEHKIELTNEEKEMGALRQENLKYREENESLQQENMKYREEKENLKYREENESLQDQLAQSQITITQLRSGPETSKQKEKAFDLAQQKCFPSPEENKEGFLEWNLKGKEFVVKLNVVS